jgi:SAM-dependent methyltransferase
VTAEVPDRVRWAVDLLKLQPHHRVMEIGCGPGVAAGVIADRLAGGFLLAIDRSATAIDRASRRNRRHVDTGRIEFRTTGLAELEVGSGPFDAVLATNVNLFWTGPAIGEWSVLEKVLSPDATLVLAYGYGRTGAVDRRTDAVTAVGVAMRTHGFRGAERSGCGGGCWAWVGRRTPGRRQVVCAGRTVDRSRISNPNAKANGNINTP